MHDSLSSFTHRLIKASRSEVQEGYQLGLTRLQPNTQRLTKEVMETIPLPFVIQQHHKEVRPLQRLQHILTRRQPRTRRDGLTESRIHALKDRGLEQKVLEWN